MSKKAPGKYYRKGMSIVEMMRMFPDDETAEEWFASIRWPHGAHCPHCGSTNVQSGAKHKTMTYRCRDKECGRRFSVKTKTVMEGSNLGFQAWAIAAYLLTTSLKGVSSMKLHRDLEITQKSAWHLAHRIRKSFESGESRFSGFVKVDESYIGGKEGNKHEGKKLKQGRGAVGKTAVVGAKDRKANKVSAKVVNDTKRKTLHGFIQDNVEEGSTVCTDDFKSYLKLKEYEHNTMRHSAGENVNKMAHINGKESFWSMLKRSYQGTYHKMSFAHLNRYFDEFSGRHNVRSKDTIIQMSLLVSGMVGKSLRYKELVE